MRRRDGRLDCAAHLREPGRDAEKKVGLRADRDLLVAEGEMPVEHRVQKLAALAAVFVRHRASADLRQERDERVVRRKSGQPVEQPERNARLFLQGHRRIAHLLADGDGPGGAAHARDVFDGNAAQRRRREVVGHVAVERAGKVGQEQRLKAERLEDVAQLVQDRQA